MIETIFKTLCQKELKAMDSVQNNMVSSWLSIVMQARSSMGNWKQWITYKSGNAASTIHAAFDPEN
jgi:hypothetical protein